LWTDWPVHDASIDLVVSIFAPRSFAETARVLRPRGWLVLLFPGSGRHLVALAGLNVRRNHLAKRISSRSYLGFAVALAALASPLSGMEAGQGASTSSVGQRLPFHEMVADRLL
jgi:SAM-dependent methyltransferase